MQCTRNAETKKAQHILLHAAWLFLTNISGDSVLCGGTSMASMHLSHKRMTFHFYLKKHLFCLLYIARCQSFLSFGLKLYPLEVEEYYKLVWLRATHYADVLSFHMAYIKGFHGEHRALWYTKTCTAECFHECV